MGKDQATGKSSVINNTNRANNATNRTSNAECQKQTKQQHYVRVDLTHYGRALDGRSCSISGVIGEYIYQFYDHNKYLNNFVSWPVYMTNP